MIDKIYFLNNLNRVLKQIEREIIERVIVCLEMGEYKLKNHDAFTIDYEVEATVAYYIEGMNNPIHCFYDRFNYKDVIIDKDYGMLLDDGNDTDWHREHMPRLDETYCYLLHDLIDHSHTYLGDRILDIERIWVDVIFTDQKGVKVGNDGTCRPLYYNDQKKSYT